MDYYYNSDMISPAITTNLRSRVSKKEVKLHDLKPTESIGSSATGKVCLVCTVKLSSYCCPQCFIPYCSSNCYLKHGVECTEAFSRQRVKSVLDLETKERITDTTVDLPDQRVYGNFRDGKEFSHLENRREKSSDWLLEDADADESDTDALESDITDSDDPALIADMKQLGELIPSLLSTASFHISSFSDFKPQCRDISTESYTYIVLCSYRNMHYYELFNKLELIYDRKHRDHIKSYHIDNDFHTSTTFI
jgi:hypothetical protein